MDISDPKTILIFLAFAGMIAAAVIYVFNRRKVIQPTPNSKILDPGWQFFPKPTTLDAPGTVFRIDEKGHRYIVTMLKVKITKGKEVSGHIVESGQASLGIIASLLGLDKMGLGANAKKVERLEFELINPVREETTDADINLVLDPFLERMEYIDMQRYFIIRETRMASAMKYYMSERLLNDFSEGTPDIRNIKAQAEFKQAKKGEYVIDQKFDEPMRIMFLPDELRVISRPLAGSKPQWGMFPVTETLAWEEG